MMKIYRPEDFPNLLNKISLTSDQIKEQIRDYSLIFLSVRNRYVEWGLKLPMFVNSFYDYIIKFQKVPSQQDFWNHYLYFNSEYFSEKNFTSDVLEGIKARCFRTYPSLVRDIYFNKYVEEKLNPTDKVVYNINLDVQEGIDMMIEEKAGVYKAINLYVNTQRAIVGRQKKEFRHTKFDNVEYVEFPVDFKGSEKVGNFFMYGKIEFEKLKEYL